MRRPGASRAGASPAPWQKGERVRRRRVRRCVAPGSGADGSLERAWWRETAKGSGGEWLGGDPRLRKYAFRLPLSRRSTSLHCCSASAGLLSFRRHSARFSWHAVRSSLPAGGGSEKALRRQRSQRAVARRHSAGRTQAGRRAERWERPVRCLAGEGRAPAAVLSFSRFVTARRYFSSAWAYLPALGESRTTGD